MTSFIYNRTIKLNTSKIRTNAVEAFILSVQNKTQPQALRILDRVALNYSWNKETFEEAKKQCLLLHTR